MYIYTTGGARNDGYILCNMATSIPGLTQATAPAVAWFNDANCAVSTYANVFVIYINHLYLCEFVRLYMYIRLNIFVYLYTHILDFENKYIR
jgi:hypothetical protein